MIKGCLLDVWAAHSLRKSSLRVSAVKKYDSQFVTSVTARLPCRVLMTISIGVNFPFLQSPSERHRGVKEFTDRISGSLLAGFRTMAGMHRPVVVIQHPSS